MQRVDRSNGGHYWHCTVACQAKHFDYVCRHSAIVQGFAMGDVMMSLMSLYRA